MTSRIDLTSSPTVCSARIADSRPAIFLSATKLDMLSVPYAGQPPAILDLMSNRVQFNVASIGLVAEHINRGSLKPLAVLGTARSPLLPNVPTITEAGYPEFNVVPWYG